MNLRFLLIVIALPLIALSCTTEPQQVEITREVIQEVPVTVEVTRVVTEIETVEVAMETTRLVEVVVTATPAPTETAVAETEPTPEPTATPSSNIYTVQSGDNLSIIANRTGATVAIIREANDLTADSILTVGQELVIPGWDGVERVVEAAPTTPAGDPAAPPPPGGELVATGPNLLPNPSFEGDWYFHHYNELQVPDGWQLTTDEGPNTLEPGSGGNFYRPEVRVIPRPDLPPHEQNLFIFDGDKTIKAFKGGAPTSFSLFTDVVL